MTEYISAGLSALGLDPEKGETLSRYGRLLAEGNQTMNLTAITQPREIADLHMLDSAALLSLEDLRGKSLVDVGTGAGFPGLVLCALEPTLEVTLLDSLQKRVNWLEETAGALGLSPRCLHGRAEDLGRDPQWRESFDVATARAVADLRLLCELCLPLVKVGGRFLAMKAADCRDELQAAEGAIAALGGTLREIREYALPGTGLPRVLAVVEKTAPTPQRYPRRFARIQRDPL